jgi:hypothetical protein
VCCVSFATKQLITFSAVIAVVVGGRSKSEKIWLIFVECTSSFLLLREHRNNKKAKTICFLALNAIRRAINESENRFSALGGELRRVTGGQ